VAGSSFRVPHPSQEQGVFGGGNHCAGLGIGANATVFSLANGILFKSLPFQDSDKVSTSAVRT
jgi:hypothetical protein